MPESIRKDIKVASGYSIGSNVISLGLVATVVIGRLPDTLTNDEKALIIAVLMATLTWVINIVLVIYKKKVQPKFQDWLEK